ncbi:transcriptional regulator [Pseudoxanthomonas broegbernensis]|uniref:Transcriptional regulator n=1 Tax=Pseudoxanthomonas broegbernensis TaxID=83619 RepID=A0A7V8GND0_9GAMM|nr:transcriptional regulator [Pseudoxanthomonas broegbernensis]KAF1687026.1 transcriptional regulator [Pseudoxanthomonas broegbernensis]MBB6065354.1 hypothetical protein [Pseudoxanthomonas broegbernensis]
MTGRETPGFRWLPARRAALGRSLDELIVGPVSSQAPRDVVREASELYIGNAEERNLLVRYRTLPPMRRQALLALIKPAK